MRLQATAAKLRCSYGLDYGLALRGKWVLTCTAELHPDNSLELASGEPIQTVALAVNFQQEEADKLEWLRKRVQANADDHVQGALSYHRPQEPEGGLGGRPALLIFDLQASPALMADLVDLARHGRYPRTITVDVQGLTFGWAPDGSELKWDNGTRDALPISNFDFEVPLNPAEHSAEREVAAGAGLPEALRGATTWAKWIVAGLVLVGVAILRRGL